MKNKTDADRKQELIKAKKSQKAWTKIGRTWRYEEIVSLLNERDPCRTLINRLRSKGFFVIGDQGGPWSVSLSCFNNNFQIISVKLQFKYYDLAQMDQAKTIHLDLD